MIQNCKRRYMGRTITGILLAGILCVSLSPASVMASESLDLTKWQDDFLKSTILYLDATQLLFLDMKDRGREERYAHQVESSSLMQEFLDEAKGLDQLIEMIVLALKRNNLGYAIDDPVLIETMRTALPESLTTDRDSDYMDFGGTIEDMKDRIDRCNHQIGWLAEHLEVRDRVNKTKTADSFVPKEISRRYVRHLISVSRISLELLDMMRGSEVKGRVSQPSEVWKQDAELGICAELSIHLGTMKSNVLVDVVCFVAPHEWSRVHDTVQLLRDGRCYSSRRVESRGGGRVRKGKHSEEDVRKILDGVIGLVGDSAPLLAVGSHDPCTIVRWRRGDDIQRVVIMGELGGQARETLRLLVSVLPFSDRYDIDRFLGRSSEGEEQRGLK